jgi:hypothetical protein
MSDRPNPLGTAASKVGTAWSAAAGVVGALVAFGVLSSAQADALNAAGSAAPDALVALGTLIAGVVPLVSGVVASFRTAAAARDHVTPVADPRAVDPVSGDLVPLVPTTAPCGGPTVGGAL